MHVLVQHNVRDFDEWKIAFDEHSSMRKAGGEKSHKLFHAHDNPNDLILLFEWENMDKAKTFLSSQDLKETMEKAGVIGAPKITFLREK